MIEQSRYGSSSTASDRARERYHREQQESWPGERRFARFIDRHPRIGLALVAATCAGCGIWIAYQVVRALAEQVRP